MHQSRDESDVKMGKRNPAFGQKAAAVAVAFLTTASAAVAQNYHCTVNPATSSLSSTIGVFVTYNGNILGTYSATNTSGSRTVPGPIGGTATTNTAIPINGNGGTGNNPAVVNTKPTGVYDLRLNGNTVRLSGLNLNLVGSSASPTIPISLAVNYSTFRTFAPSYFYVSFGAVTVPVGNATVTTLTLRQDQVITGPLTPVTGGYTFSLNVPCTLHTVVELQGTATTNDTPATLTISGTVTTAGGRQPTITTSLSLPLTITQAIPPTPGTPTPFDLPPPPPNTAPNVPTILTVNIIAPSSTTVNGTAALPASGAILSPADIADGLGDPLPSNGFNPGVDGGDFDCFFNYYFEAAPLNNICDIADGLGEPLPAGFNPGVDGGDFDCFFNWYFL